MAKNSQLLEYLMNTGKKEIDSESTSLTSIGLMIAALDMCCIHQDETQKTYGDEVLDAAHILENLSESPKKVLDKLKDYVTTSPGNNISDTFTLQTRLYGAQGEADKNNENVLTADKMLSYLLSHPSDVLKNAFSVGNICYKSNGSDSSENLSGIIQAAKDLREKLSSRIFGQDHAIQTMVSGYFRSEINAQMASDHSGPRAIFLFAGPPGVGKTFLAESTAKILDLPYARYDMSEYGFNGAVKSFIDSGNNGSVGGFVLQHPHSVLLFDEIEKADESVIHLFLQILDAGTAHDSFSRAEISFKDTIVIFTTNAGRPLYEDSETDNFSNIPKKTILKALETDMDPRTGQPYFPEAICSRLSTGNVVMFNYMTAHNLVEIARHKMLQQAENFEKRFNISLVIDEDVYAALLFSEGGNADARIITGRAETFLAEELYELVRLTDSEANKSSIAQLKTVQIKVKLPENGEIKELFSSEEKQNALIFASKEAAQRCSELSSTYQIYDAQSVEKAKEILSENDIALILVDPTCGQKNTSENYLNIEDVDSEARDFLFFEREQYKNTPVYILETKDYTADEEEVTSYQQAGVWGFVNLESDDFAQTLQSFSEQLHQQNSMQELARGNLIVNYQTGQLISEDGSSAEINLFDFVMQTAVDPDESDNILSGVSKPDVHFDQIIGAKDAKEELQYFIQYLKNPKKYMKNGGHAPRGVLLYGPPGTGKTTLAKAMACEAGVTFIAVQGNQFLKKWVGEGPDKLRDTFRIARKYAPSILFIDEIDTFGSNRAQEDNSRYRADLLNVFLNEMDGFDSRDPSRPVFVLAATNYDASPGSRMSLDPAMLRRFDRQIYVDLPGKEDRVCYLNMKINDNNFFSVTQEEINNLANRSAGMSLADLESVLDAAMRLAVRKNCDKVTDSILDEAFETQSYGEEKKWDASELERTARHEAGHAYINWKSGETPSYITVVARGDHGGYMQHDDNENKHGYTKEELLSLIRTSLGGRAAELVYYGEKDGLTTGASSDLEHATYYAEQTLCTYGMDPDFGMAVIDTKSNQNPEMSMEIRNAVNTILSSELEKAIQIIKGGKDDMDKIVNALIENDHLTGEEFEALLK